MKQAIVDGLCWKRGDCGVNRQCHGILVPFLKSKVK